MKPDIEFETDLLNTGEGAPNITTAFARKRLKALYSQIEAREIPLVIDFPDRVEEEGFGQPRVFIVEDFAFRNFKTTYPHRELPGVVFVQCELRRTKMRRFNLRNSQFSKTDVRGSVFHKSVMDNSRWNLVDARWSELNGASVADSSITTCNFSGADLRNCKFSKSTLAGTAFVGALAKKADFTGADLKNCDFSGCDLTGAILSGARIDGTNFSFANMTNCTISPVQFPKGNYYGVTVSGNKCPIAWPAVRPEHEEKTKKDLSFIRRLRDYHFIRNIYLRFGWI